MGSGLGVDGEPEAILDDGAVGTELLCLELVYLPVRDEQGLFRLFQEGTKCQVPPMELAVWIEHGVEGYSFVRASVQVGSMGRRAST